MLTSLYIENFKAWKDTDKIHLAPLTIIFGANSAGKSSLGHLLLALKQTVLSADRRRPLHLGDENSLIELGTFAECIHNHDLQNPLSFSLGWKLASRLDVRDPLTQAKFTGDELCLDVSMLADKNQQPRVSKFRYQLLNKQSQVLAVEYQRNENDKWELNSDQYKWVKNTGRAWPLEDPDKFYRISDQSRARFQNADFQIGRAHV